MGNKKDISSLQVVFVLSFLVIFPAIIIGVEQWQTNISSNSNIETTPHSLMILTGESPESSSIVTSFSWGVLYPNSSATYTLWIYNDYPQQSMELSLTTTSWSPAIAANYLTVSWNREGYILPPKSSILITLVLTVSADIENITNFDLNFTISGTEVLE